MNDQGKDKDKDKIAYLTMTFLLEDLTSQEQDKLRELLKDTANRSYFKKMYNIWHVQHNRKESVQHAFEKLQYKLNNKTQKQPRSIFTRVAAAIFIAFTMGAISYHFLTGNNQAEIAAVEISKIIVPLGSKSSIELPDGTMVTLNAGSRLHYQTNFGTTSREVWLDGEGYFKVMKNEAIPFVVKAKNITVTALGTEFNVKAYSEEEIVQATLVNGIVTVLREDFPESQKVLLKPRQTITIYEQSETIKEYAPVSPQVAKTKALTSEPEPSDFMLESDINTEQYTSWKDTRWVIESESMCELAIKLQRRYDVTIDVVDESLKQYRFSGILTDETLEQVLDIMKTVIPINYSVNKKTVQISIDPQQRKLFDQSMEQQQYNNSLWYKKRNKG